MAFSSSLTDICEVNSSFDKGILRVCYTGKNRNGSFFSKESIKRSIKTIYNCPVVCNYDRETDTLGGHDVEVVRDDNDNYKLVNMTTPVGMVPESANVWFDNYTEKDGTVHEYLYTEVLLWKRQEAYEKIKNDGITAHSMEIKVNDSETIDGYLHINDFEFNAFALIGVEPCFEGSALETFSKEEFKKQMEEMMQDLKETFTVKTSEEDDNTKISVEGGKEALEEKIELAKQYNIDIENLDFSLDDFTVEELTEKFESMKSSSESSESDDTQKDDYALVSNIVDEVCRILESSEQFVSDWGDTYPRYWYVDCDVDAREVYGRDMTDNLIYGFSFTQDGDSISIDFTSKKRMKVVLADFEGGDTSPVSEAFTKMKEDISKYVKDFADMKSKFADTSAKFEAMESELEELRQFKTDTEKSISDNEKEELFAKFEDLSGIEAFEELKSNRDNYELDVLEEKCYAIRGRKATEVKFSAKPSAQSVPVIKVDRSEEMSREPYGGIVEKFNKAN